MAVFALTDAFVSINSVTHSDHVKSVTLSAEVADLNSSSMGDTWKESTAGVKSGTLTLEFLDDFAAASIDASLGIGTVAFGTVVAFEIRPTSAAVSTTNPKFTGNVLIAQGVVGGSHGELAMKSVTYPTSGTVIRATA